MDIKIKYHGFHGLTRAVVRLPGNPQPGELVRLSRSQVRRLARAACGMADCRCGESLLAACELRMRQDYTQYYAIQVPPTGTLEVWGNYPQD